VAGGGKQPVASAGRIVRFAHRSERQLASLLDFYGIAWEYEPVEFALSWDERGEPTSGFRPDFYLPAYGTFLELTTLRQENVTKKNRKLHRLAELYPEVRVKIIYRRDFRRLALRFGFEEPTRLAG
jgi:hypothetical protein